jgi:hypothetical protein
MGKTLIKKMGLKRNSAYLKDKKNEDFLSHLNEHLIQLENNLTKPNLDNKHPTFFVIGAPRSGTTLLTQILASFIDTGYINNLVARFYKTPLVGLNLSKQSLGDPYSFDYKSHYAKTSSINDIHEFGYFWRSLLQKKSIESIIHSQREKNIDWSDVKNKLLNIQDIFNKPLVFKNILGSYHIGDFIRILNKKVFFIYIERNPIDTGLSIIEARKLYNKDLNDWWSYVPLEYNSLKNKDHWFQIAGQVFFLQRFYNQMVKKYPGNVIKISYEQVCNSPKIIIDRLNKICKDKLNYNLDMLSNNINTFPYKEYDKKSEDAIKIANNLIQFSEKYN